MTKKEEIAKALLVECEKQLAHNSNVLNELMKRARFEPQIEAALPGIQTLVVLSRIERAILLLSAPEPEGRPTDQMIVDEDPEAA